jgi:hypothetical protein
MADVLQPQQLTGDGYCTPAADLARAKFFNAKLFNETSYAKLGGCKLEDIKGGTVLHEELCTKLHCELLANSNNIGRQDDEALRTVVHTLGTKIASYKAGFEQAMSLATKKMLMGPSKPGHRALLNQ